MTSKPMSDSRLASLGSRLLADRYQAVEEQFRAITAGAGLRFEHRDWPGMATDAVDRLGVYPAGVTEAAADVSDLLGDRVKDRSIWAAIKAAYSGYAMDRQDFELAETFFNSVTRRIFSTVGVDPRIEYVDTDFDTPPTETREPVFRSYTRRSSTASLVSNVLADFEFQAPFRNLKSDATAVACRIEEHLVAAGARPVVDRLEVVSSPFYRGKGAYLVGRVFSGSHVVPLALAVLHKESGITVDAVLLTEDDLSILFSFAHSYFHVAGERPYDLVRFLRGQVPRKRPSELYISLGRTRHGKTELFRELRQHLDTTSDVFVEPPGKKGLVMSVFTLPGFEMVFKVIKDHFPPQKTVTPSQVMDRYRLVFHHDRAGRLVDSQWFEHLQFRTDRFDKELLDELREECSRTVEASGDLVNISDAYVQRRVIPLDVYIHEAPAESAQAAVVDYGNAISDLALTGVFPGDLLIKNFGVTRNGRVVFYDYDEMSELSACNFREIPESVSIEDEMLAEPWYPVGPNDVFPEEFESFLGLDGQLRETFLKHHSNLLDWAWWSDVQDRLGQGEIVDIYPYSGDQRLTAAR